MLLHIPGLFSREEVQRIREALQQADWADGKITAGFQSAKAKHNLQLPEGHPLAQEIGAAMLERLWKQIALGIVVGYSVLGVISAVAWMLVAQLALSSLSITLP